MHSLIKCGTFYLSGCCSTRLISWQSLCGHLSPGSFQPPSNVLFQCIAKSLCLIVSFHVAVAESEVEHARVVCARFGIGCWGRSLGDNATGRYSHPIPMPTPTTLYLIQPYPLQGPWMSIEYQCACSRETSCKPGTSETCLDCRDSSYQPWRCSAANMKEDRTLIQASSALTRP